MSYIEILEDENSIIFDNESATATYDFFPETKEFTTSMSLKDDVYFRNQIYEYKISEDPIEVLIRLKERSDEPPPDKFCVKDGVVLESEINKDSYLPRQDFIDDLKEEVQWHKLPISSGYAELFFILYLHPEIISKKDYRNFVRKNEERIKSGINKIEIKLKEMAVPDLEIIDDENGKQIWYKDTENFTGKDHINKHEFVEDNFYKQLFDENSKEFSGISRNEFINSNVILKHIETVLNKKEKKSRITLEQTPKKQKTANVLRWIAIVFSLFSLIWWSVWTALGFLFFCYVIIYALFDNKQDYENNK